MSQVSAKDWEDMITKKLWDSMSVYVFENIYLPAAQSGSVSKKKNISYCVLIDRNVIFSFFIILIYTDTFNTTVDIRLKQWAESQLPLKCVEVGWEVLREKFMTFLEKAKASKNHDDVFDKLKGSVVEEAIKRHEWEEKVS